MNFVRCVATPLLLFVLGLALLGPAQAKPRRDSGCYDRCDRALLNCRTDAAICDRDRRSCVLSCDPNPANPSARTQKRLAESDAQIHQRLSAKPATQLSSCEVRCEDAAEACGAVNSAAVCGEGREACFQRCKGKSR